MRLYVCLQAGANVNAADWAGFTALHRAAFHGSLECVVALLDAGALPNLQDIVGGRTPMHQAAGTPPPRQTPPLVWVVAVFAHSRGRRSARACGNRAAAPRARRESAHQRLPLRAQCTTPDLITSPFRP